MLQANGKHVRYMVKWAESASPDAMAVDARPETILQLQAKRQDGYSGVFQWTAKPIGCFDPW